ncbi:MAG: KHG/KDPG aldolase [Candidatus Moanabacter tarae]|uniref:2-dehydro-3-deoxy-phosphogluconate aldolase n=1 Tax=Candidatus Moanibacter tarae TaxID=2200854 RepID=A0A2Z4AQS2_9BACT|nr:MAG: KHG/KDPG aldolase [Candidatus Moanabacter tarae]|tara:strand:+ start:24938 stop:25588 length:651 start_codon:yes stop_codon:yes gene_type:complete
MELPFNLKLAERLSQTQVVAVIVIEKVEDAVPMANALMEGGIDAIELTLRTPVAIEAMKKIVRELPEMSVGIGTVIEIEQARTVHGEGAAFAVAPGMNRKVMEEAIRLGLSFAPGVATPSDIETALEYGCRLLKFFPAEPIGGLSYLRSMAAPYMHLGIKYIPLGGIKPANLKEYLEDPLIAAIGGSWIAPKDLINEKNWNMITVNSREAREITLS